MIKSQLKISVLKILEKKSLSGYDLVKEIHDFTQNWKPSFGSIYPLLKELLKNGLVEVNSDGRKKVYSITKKGRIFIKDILKSKEEIFNKTMDSIKNLELICDKKEIEFIHSLHTALRNNFPFKEASHEMQELTELMIQFANDNKILKNEKRIKKILKDAINQLKKLKA